MELMTIGYAPFRSGADLAGELAGLGVERVVDVRANAAARRACFDKRPLAARFADEGVRYAHARSLGMPKGLRELYAANHLSAARALFRDHLYGGAVYPWLLRLANSLDDALTCLLGVDAAPERCHRAVIAEELVRVRPSLRVVHLGDDAPDPTVQATATGSSAGSATAALVWSARWAGSSS